MDLGNIVYIVAVLAYFIYQATKGKKKSQTGDQAEVSDTPEQKPVTFEDLMREIREGQKHKSAEPAKPTIQPVPVDQPKPVQYKPIAEPVVRPEWRPDPAPAVKRFPTKKWEEADDEIEYYKGAFEKTESDLSQTSKGIPDIPSFKKIDVESSNTSQNRYGRILKDPKTLKEAIVLKEILDKRHF